jgi:hypothetical protein
MERMMSLKNPMTPPGIDPGVLYGYQTYAFTLKGKKLTARSYNKVPRKIFGSQWK